jgi:hypothetical protein
VFDLASDVYTIKKLNKDTHVFEDISVRITPWFGEMHDEDVKDDYKRLYFQNLDSQNFLGDLYEFDGYRWMSVNREGVKTITKDCTIRRCNVQLKFKHTSMSDPTTIIDGIASRKMMFTETSQYVELPRGKMEVIVPNNEDCKKLQNAPYGTRFLLGNKTYNNEYQPWEIESIDSVSFVRNTIDMSAAHGTGYVALRFSLGQISPDDDMVNGIAWQSYYS